MLLACWGLIEHAHSLLTGTYAVTAHIYCCFEVKVLVAE